MTESVLKKFGKYFLLDRIGEGGMAEIFRARLASADSSGRFIVIKRIQSAYSNNAEFVQMFRSEVQVTMRFAHPNIVQLYEAGEEDGQQFIAMELVDGRNLRQVLSKTAQKQQRVPIPAACFIIEQTAAGLHYAHVFKDRITGIPLNLVHRDVSPQNIIVSYDGNIKVIDFGIAKATTNGEATRAGVIKGKLSYLSPEQVMGDVLDGRSDVFALGIVLWELLTGKRLFVAEAENEFQVLKMIESCTTFVKPPSTLNPEVSKELDQVVMLALTRDPKNRYQTAEELARALRKVLAHEYSDFGPSDLSYYIKKLFKDLIVEDRKQLQMVNARAEELIQLGTQESHELKKSDAPGNKEHTRVTSLVSDKFDQSQLTRADRIEVAAHPQHQMKIPAQRPSPRSEIKKQPIAAPQVVADYQESKRGAGRSLGFGLALAVAVFFGYQYYQNEKAVSTPTQTAGVTTGVKIDSLNAKQIGLKVRLFPDGNFSKTRVTVNSQVFDLEKGIMRVAVGEPLEVIVDRPGFVTYRKEFTLKEEQVGTRPDWDLDIKLEPMIYGTLSISTRPSVADVRIVNLDQGARGLAQEPVSFKTPVYQEKLPAGHYKITVQNDLLGVEKSFEVDIHEGKEAVYSDVQLDSKN